MNKLNSKLIELNVLSSPILFLVIGVSILLGITAASTFNEKYITILIGAYVGTIAFAGVIYGKREEHKLKTLEINLQKTEDFSVNLFQWLESLNSLLSTVRTLKLEKNYDSINILSEEYKDGRKQHTQILTYKGKHLALISLYKKAIENEDTVKILNDILKNQEAGMKNITGMLDSCTKVGTDSFDQKAEESFVKMRGLSRILMTKIRVQ